VADIDPRRALGRRLQLEREGYGITREELAARLCEEADTVKRWELGRTRIPAERLVAIATALGITVSRLLGQVLRSRAA
jgi:transcriptional regulator with XRE-family HTH domain